MNKFILGATSSAFLLPVACMGTPLLCKVGFCTQCVASLMYHGDQNYPCNREGLQTDDRYVRDLDILIARGMTAYTLYYFSQNWKKSYAMSLFIVAIIGFSYLLYIVDSADLYYVTHSMWHITAGLAALMIFSLANKL
jgi:hypothetical protein